MDGVIAQALHDLRAAQALTDRALKALEAHAAPKEGAAKKQKAPRYFGDQPRKEG